MDVLAAATGELEWRGMMALDTNVYAAPLHAPTMLVYTPLPPYSLPGINRNYWEFLVIADFLSLSSLDIWHKLSKKRPLGGGPGNPVGTQGNQYETVGKVPPP